MKNIHKNTPGETKAKLTPEFIKKSYSVQFGFQMYFWPSANLS